MTAAPSRELVDPESVGIHPGRLAVLIERVRQDVDHGPLPSAQIAVAKDGHLVAFESFGDTTPATRYITQSAGRPILAACAWKLMSDGLLDIDEHVADVIPEFGTNGKDVVTYRNVLTHSGGFPMAPIRYPDMTDRAKRLDWMSRWRLTFDPGTELHYHLTSAGWVIADTIEARTGMTLRDYLTKVISEPLGLDIEVGVPVEKQAATVAPILPLVGTPDGFEVDPWGPWFFREPEVLAAGEPSHTICATAADVVLLFQSLYHSGMWDPAVVELATSAVVEMPMGGDYGVKGTMTKMGLFVGRDGPPTASDRTWGHGGAPSSLSWHDPEVDLSVAFYNNGYPAAGYDTARAGRNRSKIVSALAGDILLG
ncbi:MAG: beta-lactamase family protein [Acidobacteria bacterium]|nr:beta-lactamase family protein [Acidobacteriota bacterium]